MHGAFSSIAERLVKLQVGKLGMIKLVFVYFISVFIIIIISVLPYKIIVDGLIICLKHEF